MSVYRTVPHDSSLSTSVCRLLLFGKAKDKVFDTIQLGCLTPTKMLDYTNSWLHNPMPNKRHPARKYIGFWGTLFLKQKLSKIASKKGVSLSVLVTQILWDFMLIHAKSTKLPSSGIILEKRNRPSRRKLG